VIFVTGGTGLVGNCVIRELLAREFPVRALCRKGSSRKCFEGLELEIVEGDLNDVQVLRQSIAGCAAVIHAAALIHIGWTRLNESRQVNVEGTRHVVAACLEHHARLVYVSTVDTLPAATSAAAPIDEASTSGVPKTPCSYVISKSEAERVVRAAVVDQGLDAVIVHPGFMLAPYDWKPSSGRMMLQVNQTPFALAPSGGCSLCDTRDVAHAIVNAIERGRTGHSYILAGENISYRDLWMCMRTTAGRSPRVRCFPHLLNFVAKVLNRVNPLLPVRENDINGAAIAMGQMYHYYSSAKAERELEYTRRPISQTLADAWDWLRLPKSAR
jgi:dihydroflavonol-4-reductase